MQDKEGAIPHGHRDMLVSALKRIFGDFDAEMLEKVLGRFEWVELHGGEVLFRQGEKDDCLYFVISGRLRATRTEEDGSRTTLGEIARGETVGELAFFTGEPRSATVTAVRDSVLARFGSAVFQELLLAYPMISLNITRLVIERGQRTGRRSAPVRPVTIGLAAATPGVALVEKAHRLARELAPGGQAIVVTASRVDEWLGRAGSAQVAPSDVEGSRRLIHKLEEVESEHQYVLFVADEGVTEWTRRCLRHCDHVLLWADAAADATPGPVEQACVLGEAEETRPAATLVLAHPPQVRMPSGTARWLAPRGGMRHFHLRPGLARDWARLARVVGGGAVGLVLSGGGAKGFAHLGVMKALQEAGIEWDLVGGTSIGSVMGAYAAMDLPADEAIERARAAFRRNPTGDINLLPMVSLISGRRLRQTIDKAVRELMGEDARIEDLWKTYYCVTSNYSAARESVLMAGPLAKSIRASVSIPGALPPVVLDGELHIDGGTFNNFPTDVMARLGAARIVGVNLLREGSPRRYKLEELPGAWRLLFDRVRGKRHRLPGLVNLLLNTSIMASLARQQEARRMVDLYFAPPVYGCGMLDWGKFDRIVRAGHAFAREQLETYGPEGLAARLAAGAVAADTAGAGGVPELQGA